MELTKIAISKNNKWVKCIESGSYADIDVKDGDEIALSSVEGKKLKWKGFHEV